MLIVLPQCRYRKGALSSGKRQISTIGPPLIACPRRGAAGGKRARRPPVRPQVPAPPRGRSAEDRREGRHAEDDVGRLHGIAVAELLETRGNDHRATAADEQATARHIGRSAGRKGQGRLAVAGNRPQGGACRLLASRQTREAVTSCGIASRAVRFSPVEKIKMAKCLPTVIGLTACAVIGHFSRLQAQAPNPSRTTMITATVAELSEDAQRQIGRCMTTPSVGDVTVQIRVIFSPDGAAKAAHVSDSARMETDMAYRAMAENASHAIFMCPVQLPLERYPDWRELTLSFGP